MTRETRTLRALFPDPRPPRRKNFIKENVKSLRKMEQLFHANDKNAKDLKLPVIRQARQLNRNNSIGEDHIEELNERLQKLKTDDIVNHKQSANHLKTRKQSAPVVSSKKSALRKMPRTLENENIMRRRINGHRDRSESKNKTQRKLTAYSEGDACEKIGNSDNESILKCKSQGIQTLDTQDIESLYSEGVIRYPSGRSKDVQKSNEIPDENEAGQKLDDCGDNSDHDNNVDHIKKNIEHVSLASKLVSQLNNTAPPSSYRVGVVPKYIKERKEALKKEQLAKAAEKYSDCPSGHIPLPDSERKETLGMLKKNYQEYVNELNMLPIRTDTLRSQKRKMEIEKQLAKLEEAIKVFSRPKVFVKIDS